MNSWILTIPKAVDWSDYRKELDAVETGEQVLNYRLPWSSSKIKVGDKMYVTHRGKVRGWMEVVGIKSYPEGFACTTTGTYWRPGLYVQRAGKFWVVPEKDYPGFRGVRKYELDS